MFYQNHLLALHAVKIFCNFTLGNHWTWTWKISDCLTGLELTLWYDLDSENTWTTLLDLDWFCDILKLDLKRLPFDLDWFDDILDLGLKSAWTNLLGSDRFYCNQAGMMLENS